MGRKIPGKKHRSITDPEKQREKRIESLKNKINNPPRNPDDQEVPRSMLILMELKKRAKAMDKKAEKGKKRRKRKKKEELLCVQKFLDKDLIQPGMKKPDKFIPNLIQGPNETPEKFLIRVNSMTKKLIRESQFEDKFNITIEKDPATGKVLRVGKNKDGKESKGLIKKSQKKTLFEKKKEKALRKKIEDDGKDFSHLKDIVEFGEVVHRPPEKLKCSKNLQYKTVSEKKEKYKDLLLKGLINK